MYRPTVIDLFCGAGGLSKGLIEAGFDIRAAIDDNCWSARTYRANIGNHLIEASVDDVSAEDILGVAQLDIGTCDLLVGGPPCQGFSVQRRGQDEDPRNRLVLEFLRYVKDIKPKFFLIENVSGLMSKRGLPFLKTIIAQSNLLGYHVHLTKLDAVKFGVPQFRVRAFLVGEKIERGILKTPLRFLFPKEEEDPRKWKTVWQAIGDLPSPPDDGSNHPSFFNHYRESRLSSINIERLRHIPPGGGREHLPEHLQLPCHRNNPSHRHVDVYGRLSWEKPSVTLTARFDSFTRGRFGHPVENRSITLREGARIQTFPDSFKFYGNREECAKQIGNAVPPKLAEILGRSILSALNHCQNSDLPVDPEKLCLPTF